jgi:hypothetical protein
MKALFQKYYGLLPLLLLCAFYAFRAIDFPAHDFANYYFGGKFLADGNFNSSIYFPYEFNKAIADLGFRHIFASYAPNAPLPALLFLPLSFLPLAVAKFTFNAISILLFIYSVRRLASHYKIEPIFLLLLPVLFFVPIKNELLFGQVYLLLFFLIAESWLSYEKNHLAKMSIFLALAIFLKVFPVLLILVFIFKKQIRPLLFVLASCAIVLLVSILAGGIDIWIFYFQNVLPKAANGEISEAFVANYQSVFMFFKQMLVFDNAANPNAILNAPILFKALIFAFKIKIIAIGFYITRKANNSLFVISYWIFAMILLSPYGSTYTFVLLLLPYFSFVKSPLSNVKKVFSCALLFIVANIPPLVFTENNFPFSYLRLFALIILFVLFLSWFFYTINIRIVSVAAVAGLMATVLFGNQNRQNSTYLLGNDAPILIYDYGISQNQLTYNYWNEAGKNSKSISFENHNIEAAVIKDNEVFYNNRQLTFDKSNKAKPFLIDGKMLVFLSDCDRGIGFYTLRKITLH